MTTVLTIFNSKGGVGKSTVTWGISSILSNSIKTLVIDADPQATSSLSLALPAHHGTYEFFARNENINDLKIRPLPAYSPMLELLAGTPALGGLESEMASRIDKQYIFADKVSDLTGFDLVLIDTPGSASLITSAALCSSDFCLCTCSCDDAALQQIPLLEKMIKTIQHRFNPRLKWLPILPNMLDQRQNMDRAVLEALRNNYPTFEQAIPKRVSLREQMAQQRPCCLPEFETFTQQLMKEIN